MASELRVCWFRDEHPTDSGDDERPQVELLPSVKDRAWKTEGDLEHVLTCLAELAGLMDANHSDYLIKVFVHQSSGLGPGVQRH